MKQGRKSDGGRKVRYAGDSPNNRQESPDVNGQEYDEKKLIRAIDRELELCADDLEIPGTDRLVSSLADLSRK